MSYTKEEVEKLTKSHPFDLEKFKAGQLAISRSGKYVCKFHLLLDDVKESHRLIVTADRFGGREVMLYSPDGVYLPFPSHYDLVAMVPEKVKYYYGLYLNFSGIPATTDPWSDMSDVTTQIETYCGKLIEIRSFKI